MAQTVKNLLAVQEIGSIPGLGKIPCRRKWPPTPVFLPGEFRGQRSLAGYNPWGRKEWDTTDRLTLSLAFALDEMGKTATQTNAIQRHKGLVV